MRSQNVEAASGPATEIIYIYIYILNIYSLELRRMNAELLAKEEEPVAARRYDWFVGRTVS